VGGAGPDAKYTVDTTDGRPVLATSLPSSIIPVTACIYPDSSSYPLLAPAYQEYRSQRQDGIPHPDLSSMDSLRKTGRGLPEEVLVDFARIHDFQTKHSEPETWKSEGLQSAGLREDARSLCRALFPYYNEEDLQLEVDALLSSHSRHRLFEGASGSAKRAEGARAQVRMIHGLLDWVSFVWGREAAPSVSLTMSSLQRRDLTYRS